MFTAFFRSNWKENLLSLSQMVGSNPALVFSFCHLQHLPSALTRFHFPEKPPKESSVSWFSFSVAEKEDWIQIPFTLFRFLILWRFLFLTMYPLSSTLQLCTTLCLSALWCPYKYITVLGYNMRKHLWGFSIFVSRCKTHFSALHKILSPHRVIIK